MEVTFVRNGRTWKNGQNGKEEEILDVYPEGQTHRHYKGFCEESFHKILGIKLNPKESIKLKIEVTA